MYYVIGITLVFHLKNVVLKNQSMLSGSKENFLSTVLLRRHVVHSIKINQKTCAKIHVLTATIERGQGVATEPNEHLSCIIVIHSIIIFYLNYNSTGSTVLAITYDLLSYEY